MKRFVRDLKESSVVRMPQKHDIRVCRNFVLQKPSGSVDKTKSLVRMLEKDVVARMMGACGPPGSPLPVAQIGQGGFGRVFLLSDQKSVVKVQVFNIARKLDDQVSEVFLGKLFGMNGIGPRVLSATFLFTTDPRIGCSYITMERGESLSKILKSSSAQGKREIIRRIERQFVNAMNRMLTLGFACTDLKPSNALYDAARGKLQLIDFNEGFCAQTPALVDRFASGTKSGREIVSKLPTRLRRDVVSSQILLFHMTCKLHTRTDFARSLVNSISRSETVVNNCHKMLCLSEVPDDYVHLTKDKDMNEALQSFLFDFSRLIGHNMRHYTSMATFGTSLDVFREMLAMPPSAS